MKLFAFVLALSLPATALAQSAVPAAEAQHEHHEDAMPMKAPVPPSKSVNITFQGRVTVLTVDDLLAMPQVTVHVHNAHRNTDESYTGPLLSDVLAKAGLTASKENEPLILHSSVIATGTDHYFVTYSAAEVMPSFSKGKVIVAIMKSDLPDTEGGLIQVINTSDTKPARWVHGLASINVMSLTPTK